MKKYGMLHLKGKTLKCLLFLLMKDGFDIYKQLNQDVLFIY